MHEQTVIKSNDSIQLTAPVMIPNTPDCDYDRGEKLFTVEEVKVFKETYDDYGFIDTYHSVRGVDSANKEYLVGNALKSFLLDEPTQYVWTDGTIHTYPAGTWMLTTEITDPVAMKQVEKGLINGYSLSIFKREQAEQIKAALKSSLGGLIKDLKDPVPAIVSLVYSPCQSGNKFCKLKNGENMSDDKTALEKLKQIKNILGGNDPEYVMKEDLDAMKNEFTEVFKSDEFKGFLQNTVNDCVAEAMKDISLKSNTKEPKEDEEPPKNGETNKEDKEPTHNKEEDEDNEPSMKSTNGGSKKLPQHDGGQPALKSDRAIVLGMMGRDNRGRPLQK